MKVLYICFVALRCINSQDLFIRTQLAKMTKPCSSKTKTRAVFPQDKTKSWTIMSKQWLRSDVCISQDHDIKTKSLSSYKNFIVLMSKSKESVMLVQYSSAPHTENKSKQNDYCFVGYVCSISIKTSLFHFYTHVERSELYSILDVNCGILLSCDKKQPLRIICSQLPTERILQNYLWLI